MLERILDRENLNRAYKRVRANKGAPGIDSMSVEGALEWLKERSARQQRHPSPLGGKDKIPQRHLP